MKLSVIGSSSKGNSYLIHSDSEALIIEAGVRYAEVKRALDFNVSKIAGMIISHSHGDHAAYMTEYLKQGVGVNTPEEMKSDYINHHSRQSGKAFFIGNFHILPFNVVHDVPCFGFLINHAETGRFVFITDTHYSPARFNDLNNIIIETNYSQKIIDERLENGIIDQAYYNRVLRSHMSLETAIEFLEANDLTQVTNIVLIHLSDGNSNAVEFAKQIIHLTGKTTIVADAGVEIDFNKYPF